MIPAAECVSASFSDLVAVADVSFPWVFALSIFGGAIGVLAVELAFVIRGFRL